MFSLSTPSQPGAELIGLSLHPDIVSESMEQKLVDWVMTMLRRGEEGRLPGSTYMQSTFKDPVTGKRGIGRQGETAVLT